MITGLIGCLVMGGMLALLGIPEHTAMVIIIITSILMMPLKSDKSDA